MGEWALFCTWAHFRETTVRIQYSTLHVSDWSIPLHHFYQVRLYVVDRHTGKVVKMKYLSADTFFCFHHVNAYEDKGNLPNMNRLHSYSSKEDKLHNTV